MKDGTLLRMQTVNASQETCTLPQKKNVRKKLTELIKTIKAEIAEEKARRKAESESA